MKQDLFRKLAFDKCNCKVDGAVTTGNLLLML